MKDYNFEEENNDFGQTVRLDDINKKVIEKENQMSLNNNEEDMFSSFKSQRDEGQYSLQRSKHNPPYEYHSTGGIQNANIQKNNNKKYKKTGNSLKDNKQYKLFICILSVITFLVFISVFIMVYSSTNSPADVETIPEPDNTIVQAPTVSEKVTHALLKNINTSKELSLYDITKNTNFSLKVQSDTEILGSDNKKTSLGNLKIGQILRITINDKGNPSKIELSNESWTKNGVTDIKIDSTAKTIAYGTQIYSFNNETIFQNDNNFIDSKDITNIDFVTLNGFENNVWSVDVEQYHGFILVKNKESITDGTIEIDSNTLIHLDSTDKIPVSPGSHKVLIKGANIENYATDIFVTVDETWELDLSNTQTKTGVLIIKANTDNYRVFIDEKEIENPFEPIVLERGEYTVKVTKEGFYPYEEKVTLFAQSFEMNATLEEVITSGNLTLTSNPDGAEIYIDGELKGVSPLSTKVSFGEHSIIVKKEGFKDMSASITFDDKSKPFSVILQPLNQNSETNIQ